MTTHQDTSTERQIMEQAQIFASAWSLVGGRFDKGKCLEEAEAAKEELREMVRAALASRDEAAVPSDTQEASKLADWLISLTIPEAWWARLNKAAALLRNQASEIEALRALKATQQPQGQQRSEREDIIRMAREAGFTDDGVPVIKLALLERFAALVTAAERNKAQQQGQAVSDEQLNEVFRKTFNLIFSSLLPRQLEFCRAILSLRDKPAPTLLNGLTEAETLASASVAGLVQRVPLSDGKWEVRIAGPDDVLTLDSEIDALRQANEVNKAFVEDCLKNPDDHVLCVATVNGITVKEQGNG